jgi:hypothetical protein
MKKLILFLVSGMLLLSTVVKGTETALVCDFEKLEIKKSNGQVESYNKLNPSVQSFLKKETVNLDLDKKSVIETSLFYGTKFGKIIDLDHNRVGFSAKEENRFISIIINKLTYELQAQDRMIGKDGKYTSDFAKFYNCNIIKKLF